MSPGKIAAFRRVPAAVAPDASELAACGGAARSDAALAALADVLGRQVARVDDSHAGLLGAAMVAHEGLGAEPPQPLAAERRFAPNPRRHRLHRSAAPRFDALVPTLEPVFGELAELRRSAARR